MINTIDPKDLDRAVAEAHADTPFSGVISISAGNETIFEKALGLADGANERPNTPETKFAVASGSKILTATAICRLVEQGKLSFDTKLRDCLDVEFPNFDPDVTVHHLLSHTSGIADYFDEEIDDDYEALWRERPMYRMRRPKDFLPMFQNGGMKFSPGERFGYSDGGFVVLGMIVEQQSGMSFIDYVTREVLARCDMADSGYFATDRLPANTAIHYIEDKDTGEWRTNVFAVPIVGAPDGGAYVTAPDLVRFWTALLSGKLLSPEIVKTMLTAKVAAKSEGPGLHYGYGIWMKAESDNVTSYYITGWDPGVAMVSEWFPARRTLLTILGNTNAGVFPMYRALLKSLGV